LSVLIRRGKNPERHVLERNANQTFVRSSLSRHARIWDFSGESRVKRERERERERELIADGMMTDVTIFLSSLS
jgi:hypothetical protein